jgi:ATP-binding cassette subfamily G (WHITE) protein 2 (SNQ2)
MSNKAPVQCWDNSTRGLDASNALDFARVLRKSADEENRSIVATLYQAGNGIYNQFDKVLVLVEGREIYYGPAGEAKLYFEDMGFVCVPGANIADFLTSVAVHTERKITPGYEGRVPNTAPEFEDIYKRSPLFARMLKEISARTEESAAREIDGLRTAHALEKNRSFGFLSREGSPYQVSFGKQVFECTKRYVSYREILTYHHPRYSHLNRQLRIIWGDRWSNCLRIASSVIAALITGSLFYHLSDTSDYIFMRFGALFYPILFFCLNAMSETTASFKGRPIISRHKRLGFARPAAHVIACTITDIPFAVALFSLFEVVYYFICDFEQNAASFFAQWFILLMVILCFMSFYRMVGAWCKHFGMASQISGLFTMIMMVYTGMSITIPGYAATSLTLANDANQVI